MPKQSEAWKNLERQAAQALGGVRVLRGDDYSQSDVDVLIPAFPELKVDCKYRQKHAHHSLMEIIRQKYCEVEFDVPVLVTKHRNQSGACVTVDLDYFARLLDDARLVRAIRTHCPEAIEKLERIAWVEEQVEKPELQQTIESAVYGTKPSISKSQPSSEASQSLTQPATGSSTPALDLARVCESLEQSRANEVSKPPVCESSEDGSEN